GNRFFSHTVSLGLMFAIIFIFAGIFFSNPLAMMLGGDGETLGMCRTYLRVLLIFSPFFIFNNILISFVRNDGYPHYAMTAMVCGSFANIIMDYIFIFPFKMGILGAVLATGFSPVISMIIMSPLVLKKKTKFSFIRNKLSMKLSFNIFGTGVPSLITELSSGIVVMIFNIIILDLEGNIGVAAYGVVANISIVVVSIYTGIAQGVQPLISKYYGHGDSKFIKMLLRYAVFTAELISIIVYAIIFFGAYPIAEAFNSEGIYALQNTAVSGLKIYFLGCFFVGINIALSVYFTSTDNPKPAWIISLMRGFFIIVPLAYIMSAPVSYTQMTQPTTRRV
ncbi:MAG: polysaccharide biosynthesis C-terminal domain-containing protein, partial [Ruminococcus sp.]|nr:polysaccharide biosynthesis C-terminal domain-containing protein [Ruminococcus sp.]